MRGKTFIVPIAVLMAIIGSTFGLRGDDCEVCVRVLGRFMETLQPEDKTDPKKIESEFRSFCSELKLKENRFCYFLGGTADAATGILGEMSKPMSWGMPADKICEKLKKKDSQICELRYDKQIDLKSVDLKKLKVRDLKKILSEWDESCDGCIEKGDFIKRIEELKPKHIREEL